MAVKWSWAFGPETTLELVEAGWIYTVPGQESYSFPTTAKAYTYPGSPTRHSYCIRQGHGLTAPAGTLNNKGWVCVAFYWTTTFAEFYYDYSPITIYLPGLYNGQINVFSNNSGVNTLRMSIGGAEGSDSIIPLNQWNYIAIKYDMSATTWTGSWYLNGVLQEAGTKAGMTAVTSGDQLPLLLRPGLSTNNNSYMGQIIVYDDPLEDGETPWRFATRINPIQDQPALTTGVWTPLSPATTNYEVLDSPFNTGSYTQNTGSASGDKVTVLLTGSGTPDSGGIVDQLGTIPTNIYGITLHGFASGSGQSGFVGISDDAVPASMVTGSHIQPSIAAPSYTYVTMTGSWEASSSVYMKYEVT